MEKMRGASAAAAGGRARRLKDKEREMDGEQQEARCVERREHLLVAKREREEERAIDGHREKITEECSCFFPFFLEMLLSLIRACCWKTGQGGCSYSQPSDSSFFPSPSLAPLLFASPTLNLLRERRSACCLIWGRGCRRRRC